MICVEDSEHEVAKLCYRKRTARSDVSDEILSTAATVIIRTNCSTNPLNSGTPRNKSM